MVMPLTIQKELYLCHINSIMMAEKPENKEKTRLLRYPKKLDDKIKKRAEVNHRSVTAQIIHELEQK